MYSNASVWVIRRINALLARSGLRSRRARVAQLGIAAVLVAMVGGSTAIARDSEADVPKSPNIVLILADDLGYGDLGCYGQQVIKTPRLDQMAAEGLRFTQYYAGSTVCAPARCVLMTGLHTGHCTVRGNSGPGGRVGLRNEDVTVAEMLHDAGYATALCGKWGLGEVDTEGLPNDQGFDYFYGYLNQAHAHNYYPEFLWRNTSRVPLRNVVTHPKPHSLGGIATTKVDYSADLVANEALRFVEDHRDGPFFLYWALTIPHANNEAARATGDGQEVPDYGIYADRPWPDPDKGQAAMITRMDGDVGRMLDLIARLGLDDRTLVLFTSDNGPHREGGQDLKRFHPAGPLRGIKRDLYEGGIRVPLIARWPGIVTAGAETDHIGYFGDFFATAAEIVDRPATSAKDSISFLPTLRGQADRQRKHDDLYWEFYEQGGKQAIRADQWKAVRIPMISGHTELYDLSNDVGETVDLAAERPDVVHRLESLMDDAHVEDPSWKPKGTLRKSSGTR